MFCGLIARVTDNAILVEKEVTFFHGAHEFRMLLNINEHTQSEYYFRLPNPELVELIRRTGDTMVDVGANVGVFSLLGSAYFRNVLAFEPTPSTLDRLHQNLRISDARNVAAFGYALSDSYRKEVLYENPLNIGGNKLGPFAADYKARSRKSGWRTYEVDTVTLDDILAETKAVNAVDLVKIDVEGHEVHVIRGARETIAKHRPILFVETTSEENFDQIMNMLPRHYKAWDPIRRKQTETWVKWDTLFAEDDVWSETPKRSTVSRVS